MFNCTIQPQVTTKLNSGEGIHIFRCALMPIDYPVVSKISERKKTLFIDTHQSKFNRNKEDHFMSDSPTFICCPIIIFWYTKSKKKQAVLDNLFSKKRKFVKQSGDEERHSQ